MHENNAEHQPLPTHRSHRRLEARFHEGRPANAELVAAAQRADVATPL